MSDCTAAPSLSTIESIGYTVNEIHNAEYHKTLKRNIEADTKIQINVRLF